MAARCAQPCPQEEPPPAPRRLTALAASAAQRKEKVAIIGSGNWGSAIAKVVGRNLLELGDFEDEVRMWVYQEQVDGKNLTDIINEKHENVKYLKGKTFTNNVVADPDIMSAVKGATLLIFVTPHQFLKFICPQMTTMAKGCRAISLIKGIEFGEGGPRLISGIIKDSMGGMDTSVLMGANVANEAPRSARTRSSPPLPPGRPPPLPARPGRRRRVLRVDRRIRHGGRRRRVAKAV